MMKKLFAAGCAAAVLAFAGQASAATIVAVISGTVTSGNDYFGQFGAAGADLTGKPFDATFTFDVLPEAILTYTNGNSLAGGPGSNAGAPSPGSADLTIDGQTFHFTGDHASWMTVSEAGGTWHTMGAQGLTGGALIFAFGPSTILQPLLSAQVAGIDPCVGTSECIGRLNAINFQPTYYARSLTGSFDEPEWLPIPDPTANGVPEPATWAMLLTGFFAIGGVVRRRRGALAAA